MSIPPASIQALFAPQKTGVLNITLGGGSYNPEPSSSLSNSAIQALFNVPTTGGVTPASTGTPNATASSSSPQQTLDFLNFFKDADPNKTGVLTPTQITQEEQTLFPQMSTQSAEFNAGLTLLKNYPVFAYGDNGVTVNNIMEIAGLDNNNLDISSTDLQQAQAAISGNSQTSPSGGSTSSTPIPSPSLSVQSYHDFFANALADSLSVTTLTQAQIQAGSLTQAQMMAEVNAMGQQIKQEKQQGQTVDSTLWADFNAGFQMMQNFSTFSFGTTSIQDNNIDTLALAEPKALSTQSNGSPSQVSAPVVTQTGSNQFQVAVNGETVTLPVATASMTLMGSPTSYLMGKTTDANGNTISYSQFPNEAPIVGFIIAGTNGQEGFKWQFNNGAWQPMQ